MLEYIAYALLGLVMIGCLLFATMSPEAEERSSAKRPNTKPNPLASGAVGKNTNC